MGSAPERADQLVGSKKVPLPAQRAGVVQGHFGIQTPVALGIGDHTTILHDGEGVRFEDRMAVRADKAELHGSILQYNRLSFTCI